MFWIILFWTWSITWYTTEYHFFFFLFRLPPDFWFLAFLASGVHFFFFQNTASWDPTFSLSTLHPAQIAPKEDISSISPYLLTTVDLNLFICPLLMKLMVLWLDTLRFSRRTSSRKIEKCFLNILCIDIVWDIVYLCKCGWISRYTCIKIR